MAVNAGPARHRPRSVALVAAWLAMSGAYWFLYAGFLPAFPPVAPLPWPPLHLVFGAACVIAAIGTWQLRERGRVLALVCLVLEVAYGLGWWSYQALTDAGLVDLALLIVELAFYGALVWVLLTRWPGKGGSPAGARGGTAAG